MEESIGLKWVNVSVKVFSFSPVLMEPSKSHFTVMIRRNSDSYKERTWIISPSEIGFKLHRAGLRGVAVKSADS